MDSKRGAAMVAVGNVEAHDSELQELLRQLVRAVLLAEGYIEAPPDRCVDGAHAPLDAPVTPLPTFERAKNTAFAGL